MNWLRWMLGFFVVMIPLTGVSATPCSEVTLTASLDTAFIEDLMRQARGQSVRMAIFPFEDRSQIGDDDTLQAGFAFALHDALKQYGGIGLYHPIITHRLVRQKGLSGDALFDPGRVLPIVHELNATHAILGMFQKQEGALVRFFIRIVPVGGATHNSATILEYQTEQTARFFSSTIQAAQDIVKQISKKKLSSTSIKRYLDSTPSFDAYRFYFKGMMKSGSYNPLDLKIAMAWFEKAFTRAYNFYPALEEGSRVQWMIATLEKQMGKDASLSIAEAKKWSEQARVRRLKSGKGFIPLSPLRWQIGTEALAEGLSYFHGGQMKGAIEKLTEATMNLPEDGYAHYHLGKALETIGHAGAAQQLNEARRLNTCIP